MNNEQEMLQALLEIMGKFDSRISELKSSIDNYSNTMKKSVYVSKEFSKEVSGAKDKVSPLKNEIDGTSASVGKMSKELSKTTKNVEYFGKSIKAFKLASDGAALLATSITGVLGIMDHLHSKFDKQFKITKDYYQTLSQSAMTFGTYNGGLKTSIELQDNFQKTLEKIKNESYLATPQAQELFNTIQSGYKGIRDNSALTNMSDLTAELSRTYVTAEEATKAFQDLQSASSEYAEVKKMLYSHENLSEGKMMQMLISGAVSYKEIERMRELQSTRNASPNEMLRFEEGRDKATQVQRENKSYQERGFRVSLETSNSTIAQGYLESSKRANDFGERIAETIGPLRAFTGALGDISALTGGISKGLGFGSKGIGKITQGAMAGGSDAINGALAAMRGDFAGALGSGAKGLMKGVGVATGNVIPVHIASSAVSMGGMSSLGAPLNAAESAMSGGLWGKIMAKAAAVGIGYATAAASAGIATTAVGTYGYSFFEKKDSEYIGVSEEEKNKKLSNQQTGGWIGGLSGAAIGAAIGTAILPGLGTLAGAAIGGITGSISGSGIVDFFDNPDKISDALKKSQEELNKFNEKSKDIFAKWQEINQEFKFNIGFSKQIQQAYSGVVSELSGMTGLGQQAEQAAKGQVTALKDQLEMQLQKEMSYEDDMIKPAEEQLNEVKTNPNIASAKIKKMEEYIATAHEIEENPETKPEVLETTKANRLAKERELKKAQEDPNYFINEAQENLNNMIKGKGIMHQENIALSYASMKKEIDALLMSERDLVEQKKIEADLARSKVDLSRTARLGMGVEYQLTLQNIAAVDQQLNAERDILSVMKEQYDAEGNKEGERAIYLMKQMQKEQTTINNLDKERLILAKDIREGYLQAFDAAVIGAGAFAELLPKEGFGHQYFANTPSLGGVQGTGPLISSPTMVTTSGIQYGKNAAGYTAEIARGNSWSNSILGPGMYNTSQNSIGGMGALAQESGMNVGAGGSVDLGNLTTTRNNNVNLGNSATMRSNNNDGMGGSVSGLASAGNFIVKALGLGGLIGSEQSAAASSATQVGFQAVGTVTVPVVFDIKDNKGVKVASAGTVVNLVARQFAGGGLSSI